MLLLNAFKTIAFRGLTQNAHALQHTPSICEACKVSLVKKKKKKKKKKKVTKFYFPLQVYYRLPFSVGIEISRNTNCIRRQVSVLLYATQQFILSFLKAEDASHFANPPH